MKGDNKWFLPSISSWAKVFTHLGIGDIDDLTALGEYPWREALVNAVFTSAGGVPPTTGKEYWSSSEYGDGKSAFYFSAKNGKAKFATIYKTDPMTLYENTMHIRPFIIY